MMYYGVVRSGARLEAMEVQCRHCGRRSWIAVSQVIPGCGVCHTTRLKTGRYQSPALASESLVATHRRTYGVRGIDTTEPYQVLK